MLRTITAGPTVATRSTIRSRSPSMMPTISATSTTRPTTPTNRSMRAASDGAFARSTMPIATGMRMTPSSNPKVWASGTLTSESAAPGMNRTPRSNHSGRVRMTATDVIAVRITDSATFPRAR